MKKKTLPIGILLLFGLFNLAAQKETYITYENGFNWSHYHYINENGFVLNVLVAKPYPLRIRIRASH